MKRTGNPRAEVSDSRRGRRGASRLGCLVALLFVVTGAYFGVNVGEVYLRNFKLRDRMGQEARFARSRDDAAIRSRLSAFVDSLGLPAEAARFEIVRKANTIYIRTTYSQHVELPMFVREFRFTPSVERAF